MNSTLTAFDVKEMRSQLRLTQEQLAEAMGVRLRTVARWEGGGRVPKTAATLLRLMVSMATKEDEKW